MNDFLILGFVRIWAMCRQGCGSDLLDPIPVLPSSKTDPNTNLNKERIMYSLKLLNSQLKLSAMATIFSLSIFWIRVRLFWPNPEPDFSKSIYQDMSKSSGSRVSGPRYTDWIRIRPFRKSGDGFSKPESTNLSGSGLWQKNFEVLYPDSGMQTVSGPNPSENPHLDPRFFQTLDPDPIEFPRIRNSLCRRLTGFILE